MNINFNYEYIRSINEDAYITYNNFNVVIAESKCDFKYKLIAIPIYIKPYYYKSFKNNSKPPFRCNVYTFKSDDCINYRLNNFDNKGLDAAILDLLYSFKLKRINHQTYDEIMNPFIKHINLI